MIIKSGIPFSSLRVFPIYWELIGLIGKPKLTGFLNMVFFPPVILFFHIFSGFIYQ